MVDICAVFSQLKLVKLQEELEDIKMMEHLVIKEAGNLDPLIVQSIEDHRFDDIQKIYWRNSSIDFSSINSVINSFKEISCKRFFYS